jgi:CheY-like chemotaxis protein
MRPHHVHITEDLPRLAKMLRENLELSPDFKVTGVAVNGQDLLAQLADLPSLPDIVLMDIQMPVMDGYEATKIIRETFPPDRANMIILAMTAHAHVAKDGKYKEYGMDDFVLKPFEPEDLFCKISKYVKHP